MTPFHSTFPLPADLESLFHGSDTDRRRAFLIRLGDASAFDREALWRLYEKMRVTPDIFNRLIAMAFERGLVTLEMHQGQPGIRMGVEGWIMAEGLVG